MTHTFCTPADLAAIWSQAAVVRACDDDGDASLSTEEQGFVQRAIERAANRMNAVLEMRYRLADLAGNTWCRDLNAIVAVYLLATRRGNAAPATIQEQYSAALADLELIRGGQLKVPQAPETHANIPTATNFAMRWNDARETD